MVNTLLAKARKIMKKTVAKTECTGHGARWESGKTTPRWSIYLSVMFVPCITLKMTIGYFIYIKIGKEKSMKKENFNS